MARKTKSYKDLIALAQSYGVAENALFLAAVKQYQIQDKVITNMEDALAKDELLTTKEYVKDRENIYVNPLVKELPRHCDSANKTLATMLEIINKLGHEPERKGKLEAMLSEE